MTGHMAPNNENDKPESDTSKLLPDDLKMDPIGAAINRGFVVWSWIGLLGAHIATSTAFLVFIFQIVREGTKTYDLPSYLGRITFAFLTAVPTALLAMSWMIFLMYSDVIFRHIILGSGRTDLRLMHSRFFSSIACLVLSWIAALFSLVLPQMLAYTRY